MDVSQLQEPLTIDQIDFRIQSINKGGYATILAYKDARVDMQRLDEIAGPLFWKREHINNNHNCIVSIWNSDINQWISKEDTGTESNTEKAKGLASDSFKRACFNWGIGRELYDYPLIQVELIGDGKGNRGDEWRLDEKKTDNWGNPKPVQTWGLQLKKWTWYAEFDGGKITFLAAKDQTDNVRFKYGEMKK